jgi:hypothetical protein
VDRVNLGTRHVVTVRIWRVMDFSAIRVVMDRHLLFELRELDIVIAQPLKISRQDMGIPLPSSPAGWEAKATRIIC